MCIMSSSMRISGWGGMPVIIMSSSMSIATTHFVEFNAIGSIFIFSIKSDMRKIIPDRECDRTHNIRKKELIEHKENPEWQNAILVLDHIAKYCRWSDYCLIVHTISEPSKNRPNLENIGLLNHIKYHRKKRIQEKHSNDKILDNIDSLVRCLRDNESPMEWK